MSTKDKNRLAFIDTLRGLAALYVVAYHLALLPQPALVLPAYFRRFILNGGSGVTLFFVLSAFTMCLTMQNHYKESGSTWSFYQRRFFRIAPLFYVMLLITLLFDYFWLGFGHSILDVLLSVIFGFNLNPETVSGIVRASWTIGVEMMFYLLFPFIFRYLQSIYAALAFLFLTLLIDYFWTNLIQLLQTTSDQTINFSSAYLHQSFLHQLPIFALGIVVFYLYRSAILYLRRPIIQYTVGITILVVAAVCFSYIITGTLPSVGVALYWQALIYALITLGLAIAPIPFLVNKLSQNLGVISYSMYLIHPVLIILFAPVFHKIYQQDVGHGSHYLLAGLALLSVLLPIAYLSYRWIEQPGIQLPYRKLSGQFKLK